MDWIGVGLRGCLLLCSLLGSPLAWAQANTYIYVGLDEPVGGDVYTAPATVRVTATALTIDDGIYVSSVAVYSLSHGLLAENKSGDSVSHTLTGLGPGTYTFWATARNNAGKTASSGNRSITVVAPGAKPPTVSLRAPTGQPWIAPATIGLSADAADSDGHVTKVEFFANGNLVATANAAPWTGSWSGAGVGSYSMTARATDNSGNTTTSNAVSVSVAQSMVKGNIDGIGLDAAGIYQLRGWACSTGRNAPIDVHLYAGGAAGSGGAYVGSYAANRASEPGVATACQAQGSTYRFQIPLTAALRQQYANQRIYLHGISPAGAENRLLDNSGVHAIPAPLALSRRYVYDANQRLCKTIEPESGATVIDYDAAGNVAWQASGLDLSDPANCNRTEARASGRVVSRVYDERNRLKSLTFPDGRGNQSWQYWADGLPRTVTTSNEGIGLGSVINDYAYNPRRLLIRESMQSDGQVTVLDHRYDGNGYLTGTTYPSGLAVDYGPNGLGQPTRVGHYASEVRYYPNGALRRFRYGNGLVHSMTQNARQLPARSTDGTVLDLGYAYDGSGNVAGITDHLGGRQTRSMSYDGLDRLLTAQSAMFGGDGVARYSYDALDNLRTVQMGGSQRRYHYDGSNRLTNVIDQASQATVIGLGYDVQGNLNRRNGASYEFDYGNRLRKAMPVAGAEESYRYDAYGRRAQARAGNGVIHSHYSQGGQLAYQQDARRGMRVDYLYLGGSLLAQRERPLGSEAETVRYHHTDALGSPVVVTDANQAVVERSEYAPYGQLLNRPMVDGPGYTGHVMDTMTGLVQMQQRYYDPTIGRMLSVDPVTANSSTGDNFNRYWYASNNPYRFFDPDGREDEEKHVRPDRRSLDSCLSCRGANGSSVSLHGEGGKKRSDAQSSNAERAGPGSVFASSAAASEAGDDFVTELNGGPVLDALFGDPYLVNVVPIGDAFTYTLTPINAGMPPAVGLRGASIGSTVFRTAHYASRLEAAGLNVARTQTIIAREVARVRQNLAIGADVVGRMRVNGVLIEYRMRALPNGNVNVGTIFPVK
ncbi:RHS repeat domain-containing protein [Pseudomonas sp. Hp2]|uniref:RHS repeat domain-containing protein n=1 Tax=Pseudomonas sp. Hp2 TaxID=701189 RepID=UPI0015AAFEFE|nr:RHS repeat-associated core domain-containing protein [Pseudomonas sp. Hp2]